MRNIIDFSGKRFLVTGAGGIGAATAKLLNSLGASIILIDVNEANINTTLKQLSGKNYGYVCDFSKIEQIEPLLKTIVSERGCFDGMAYCVGIGSVRPLRMSKYDFMLTVMNINYFAFAELIRCISLKGNYNTEGTNIVGVSAIGAYLGNSTKTAYCASKGAMNAAVRCMAKELASKNIRVNTVAPGSTDTPMARAAEEYGTGSDAFKSILERQYLGICRPEDIANTIAFLLSDMSRKITGNCICVDGGKLSS